jgi:beta-1,4-mannosyl-glycoprotein beta-1,4-N-acetylglucosaminyltransferase
MKIFDCFMYCDENMLLDIRLNTLDPYVDKFVIVESNFYHNGKVKNFIFDINDYQNFKEKIIYIKVSDRPLEIKKNCNNNDIESVNIFNSLLLDNFQRNKILLGLVNANQEDIVIISDIDEIPNLANVDFRLISKKFIFFKQDFFYYKFNLKHPNLKWFGSKATKLKNLKTPQFLRNLKNKVYPWWRIDILFSKKKSFSIKIIEDGGWHFTNIKTANDIYKKMTYFAHHTEFEESGITAKDINQFIKDEIIYYDHKLDQSNQNKWNARIPLEKTSINKLPNYIQKNYNKLKFWIKN